MMAHVNDGIVRILRETVTCPQSGVVCCDQLSSGCIVIAKFPPLTLGKAITHNTTIDHYVLVNYNIPGLEITIVKRIDVDCTTAAYFGQALWLNKPVIAGLKPVFAQK